MEIPNDRDGDTDRETDRARDRKERGKEGGKEWTCARKNKNPTLWMWGVRGWPKTRKKINN